MASNSICLPVLVLLFLLFALCEAREVIIDNWTVESIDNLNKWSHRHHFTTGDVLKWKPSTSLPFEPPVLQASKEAYESCEISNPLKENVTEVTLTTPGLFFFISGIKELCVKGLKITMKVHAARKHGAIAPAWAPASAPEMNNMAAEPAAPPTSTAAPRGLLGAGFMGFVVFGVSGVVGICLNV